MTWCVYIILCNDESLYTGISTDVEHRFKQHAAGQGAKYFRARKPERLVYLESRHDRSSASRRERVIKNMQRAEKWRLIDSRDNELRPEQWSAHAAFKRGSREYG